MPNSINLTNLPKFKFGNNVTPTSPAVAHGSILINTDDGSMFVDLSGNRIRITDIVHVANSSVLESITSPEPKIYMTDSTGDLYISKVSSGQSGRTWNAIYDEDDAGPDESSYYAVYDGTITPYEVNNTQQYATVNGQQYPIYTVNYTATVKSYGEDQTPLSGTYYLRPIGDPEMNIWGWGMVQNPSTEHVANSFAHWGEVDVNEGGVMPTDIPPHNGRLWNDDIHAGAFTTFDIGTAGGSRVWVNLTATEGSVTPAQLQDVLSGYMRKNIYDSNSDDKVDSAAVADVANSVDWNNVQNKPSIPSAVTESTVAGWGFTKNTGTYSKPSTGIPKSDLADDVKTSLGKADSAVQSEDLAAVATSGSYNDLSDKPNIPAGVTVDSTLSSTSENPVQNKVVTAKLNNHETRITLLEHPKLQISIEELPAFNGIYSWNIANSRYEYDNNGTTYTLSGTNTGIWYLENGNLDANEIAYTTGSTDILSVLGTKTWNGQGAVYMDSYTVTISKAGESSGSGDSVKPKLMLTVPVSSNNADLYLIIQKASSPSGTYTQILNTRTNSSDAQKMRVFNNGSFNEVYENSGPDSSGVGSGYANRVCVIDVESLMDLGDYYRYQWVTYSGSINNSDWSGGYYPSSNEQIANLADRVQNLENRIQVVSELPANPTPGILYLIPETE